MTVGRAVLTHRMMAMHDAHSFIVHVRKGHRFRSIQRSVNSAADDDEGKMKESGPEQGANRGTTEDEGDVILLCLLDDIVFARRNEIHVPRVGDIRKSSSRDSIGRPFSCNVNDFECGTGSSFRASFVEVREGVVPNDTVCCAQVNVRRAIGAAKQS